MRTLKQSEIEQVSGAVSFTDGGAALGSAIGDVIGYNTNLLLNFIPGVATIKEVAHIGPDFIKDHLSTLGGQIGHWVGGIIDRLH